MLTNKWLEFQGNMDFLVMLILVYNPIKNINISVKVHLIIIYYFYIRL